MQFNFGHYNNPFIVLPRLRFASRGNTLHTQRRGQHPPAHTYEIGTFKPNSGELLLLNLTKHLHVELAVVDCISMM